MRCPFLGSRETGTICKKSLSGISPDKVTKLRYCDSDNIFSCPILLASILRGGQKRPVEKYHQVCPDKTL